MQAPFNPIRTVSVIGLGYVGLPVAVAFARQFKTIGFDVNSNRVSQLSQGIDKNGEISSVDLMQKSLQFELDIEKVRAANFHIVAVPTPIDDAKQPDLKPILGASRLLAKILKPGDIVVYESTVFPGLTEEECIPVLEITSGLKAGVDFKVGYSPERINPGDHEHTFTKIKKIVSGQDEESLGIIAQMYSSVIPAGVHRVNSIKVAEAAKVIENTQRDLNIALMNELAIIFDQIGIDTKEVLEAASTKWNFLPFSPGLVGGHCIGVDPYYLTQKAERLNYHPQVILAGRRINDGMGKFIAQKTIKQMIQGQHDISNCRVTILGFTFKENCKDIRNSRVIDIVRELEDHGIHTQICDPFADPDEAKYEYGISLIPFDDLPPANAIIVAVAHTPFKILTPNDLRRIAKEKPILIDVKSVFSPSELKNSGFRVWRL